VNRQRQDSTITTRRPGEKDSNGAGRRQRSESTSDGPVPPLSTSGTRTRGHRRSDFFSYTLRLTASWIMVLVSRGSEQPAGKGPVRPLRSRSMQQHRRRLHRPTYVRKSSSRGVQCSAQFVTFSNTGSAPPHLWHLPITGDLLQQVGGTRFQLPGCRRARVFFTMSVNSRRPRRALEKGTRTANDNASMTQQVGALDRVKAVHNTPTIHGLLDMWPFVVEENTEFTAASQLVYAVYVRPDASIRT